MYDGSDVQLMFPGGAALSFAALGGGVLALAWVGRRLAAAALPVVALVVSPGPAYWGEGPTSPHPIGSDDRNLWGSLVVRPAMESTAHLPSWPLVLGSLVQTALVLIPLMVIPGRTVHVRAVRAMGLAVLPGFCLAIVAMAAMENVTADALNHTLLGGLVLATVAALIVTGAGSPWIRIPAAVVVPACHATLLVPADANGWQNGVGLTVATLAVSVLVVAFVLTAPWLRRRLAGVTSRRRGVAPA